MTRQDAVPGMEDFSLTKVERMALEGIYSRRNTAQAEFNRAAADADELLTLIAVRMGLDEHALTGSEGGPETHRIDQDKGRVVPLPKIMTDENPKPEGEEGAPEEEGESEVPKED